jgi:integrase
MMIFHYARKNDIACSVRDELYLPKVRKTDVKAFTREEQRKIDDYLKDHPDVFNLSVYLSMYCGLRIGEVCALQWKDIHMEQATMHISKTLIRIQNKSDREVHKTEIVLQEPKTNSSVRVIPIPLFLQPLLEKYKNEDDTFVITGKTTCMEPRVCLRKFKKMIAKIDVSDYTFHSCRHTFATRCVEIGMDAKTLSEILGHASIKTTLERYVHPSIDLKRAQMNKLEGISAASLK